MGGDEKDWDKARRSGRERAPHLREVPCDLLIGLKAPDHRFIAVNASIAHSVRSARGGTAPRGRSFGTGEPADLRHVGRVVFNTGEAQSGPSGGCRRLRRFGRTERFFDFLVTRRPHLGRIDRGRTGRLR